MAFGFFKKKKKHHEKEVRSHYLNLKVTNIIQEIEDAITIVFEMPENKIDYESGQFLTIIREIDGKEVRRSYSFSSSPFVDSYLAVTIKRVVGGLMSNELNDNLKVGDIVKVMEPMGAFTTKIDKNNKRHLVMFAGGSGITPMMSILKSILSQEPESMVTLIYSNRNIDSIIFKHELNKLENEDEGRLRVIHILDEAPVDWQGYSGLLNHEILTAVFERMPDWGVDKTTYLMCGPEGLMNNVATLLAKQNIPGDRIFKESFVTGTIKKEEKAADDNEIVERVVTIIYDDEEYKVTVAPNEFILDAALDDGIDVPFSCQSGLCTACRGKCTSGKVKMDEEEGLTETELKEGYVLNCVAHPLTDDVVIEIE